MRRQRQADIGNQITGVLNADRETDGSFADANALALRLRHAGVGGARRVAGQRFGATEADRQLEQL